MTFGSLFAGIGGIDLGLERAGMECRWQVEIDPFCRKVLTKHWPDVPKYEDVRDVGAELESVDLICGGFPCQPVSVAGKRLAQDDERWLWPEFARIIRALRPSFVLVENVPGLLVRGIGDVLRDLASLGYDAEWLVFGADDVGAPHRRKRVFIVAHPEVKSIWTGLREGEPGRQRGRRPSDSSGAIPDTTGERCGPRREGGPAGFAQRLPDPTGTLADPDPSGRERTRTGDAGQGDGNSPHGHFIGGRCGWTVEPDVGRVAHGVPARVDRLRGLGNAVVPQVAQWIGERIINASM